MLYKHTYSIPIQACLNLSATEMLYIQGEVVDSVYYLVKKQS